MYELDASVKQDITEGWSQKSKTAKKEGVSEMRDRRNAYQRDYDSSVSGFGRKDSLAYQQDGGANDEGWDREEHDSHDSPHDVHIDGRKWKTFDSRNYASNVARKLQAKGKKATVHRSNVEVDEAIPLGQLRQHASGPVTNPFGNNPPKAPVAPLVPGQKIGVLKPTIESATAGATSAANVGVGAVYKNKPVSQPKNKNGTAKNALDMKGANLLGGGSIKR